MLSCPHSLHILGPRVPQRPDRTATRGNPGNEDRRGERWSRCHSKCLDVVYRANGRKMKRAVECSRGAAWDRRRSLRRLGLGAFCQGIRGPTRALRRVPSSSVLKPDLGQKEGDVNVKRSESPALIPLVCQAKGNAG